jgi:hypothetical protein
MLVTSLPRRSAALCASLTGLPITLRDRLGRAQMIKPRPVIAGASAGACGALPGLQRRPASLGKTCSTCFGREV